MKEPIEYDKKHLIEWIEARAVRDHDNGCLIWKGSMAHGSDPQGRYLGRITLVRRAIIEARSGKPMKPNQVAKCSCDALGCVEPSHVITRTRSALAKGRKFTQAHKAKISASVRASTKAKLTQEAVDDIRTKQEKREVYAARYGILPTYVNDIQSFVTWKEYVANPFAGLMG